MATLGARKAMVSTPRARRRRGKFARSVRGKIDGKWEVTSWSPAGIFQAGRGHLGDIPGLPGDITTDWQA